MVEVQSEISQQQTPEAADVQLVPPAPAEIEQMKQVLTFLETADARGQALEIIQGYTGTAQNR